MEHLPNRSNFFVRDLDIPVEMAKVNYYMINRNGKAIVNDDTPGLHPTLKPEMLIVKSDLHSDVFFKGDTAFEVFVEGNHLVRVNLVTQKECRVAIEHIAYPIKRMDVCSMTGLHVVLTSLANRAGEVDIVYVISANWDQILWRLTPHIQAPFSNQEYDLSRKMRDVTLLSADTVMTIEHVDKQDKIIRRYTKPDSLPSYAARVENSDNRYFIHNGCLFTHNKGKVLRIYNKDGLITSYLSFEQNIDSMSCCDDDLIVHLAGDGGFKLVVHVDPGTVAYASTVLLCDGYFRLDDAWCPVMTEDEKKANRFFNIASKLPLDLQMVLCNKLNKPGLQERMFIPKEELDSCILSILKK